MVGGEADCGARGSLFAASDNLGRDLSFLDCAWLPSRKACVTVACAVFKCELMLVGTRATVNLGMGVGTAEGLWQPPLVGAGLSHPKSVGLGCQLVSYMSWPSASASAVVSGRAVIVR